MLSESHLRLQALNILHCKIRCCISSCIHIDSLKNLIRQKKQRLHGDKLWHHSHYFMYVTYVPVLVAAVLSQGPSLPSPRRKVNNFLQVLWLSRWLWTQWSMVNKDADRCWHKKWVLRPFIDDCMRVQKNHNWTLSICTWGKKLGMGEDP